MKKLTCFIFFNFLSVSSWATDTSDLHNQMNGINIKSCTAQMKDCIEVKFKKAEMSQWTELFAFKDYEATFFHQNSSKKIKGLRGYFDLDQNKIVLQTETPRRQEILIDLKTLERQEFPL